MTSLVISDVISFFVTRSKNPENPENDKKCQKIQKIDENR